MAPISERRALRRIADPVVAAAPAGVRIRTRIHLSDDESAALAGIGSFLGSVYRGELAARVELGRLDHKAHAAWRAQRKQALTAVSSSRWAGAITRAVEDQYQLGMRALGAHVADLRSAVEVLQARCVLLPGELEAIPTGARRSRRRGYRTPHERFAKPAAMRPPALRRPAGCGSKSPPHWWVSTGGISMLRRRWRLATAVPNGHSE